MVCALLLLANFVASILASYQLLRTVCTLPDPSNCPTGQLTPNAVQALAYLHLSLSGYAVSFVTLAEWIGLGTFLLTFPTGRFVPRWSWLVLSCWIISFVWNSPPPFLAQFQVLQIAVPLCARP